MLQCNISYVLSAYQIDRCLFRKSLVIKISLANKAKNLVPLNQSATFQNMCNAVSNALRLCTLANEESS